MNIHIIITTYNRPNFFKHLLESIYNQDMVGINDAKIRLWIGDDMSSDEVCKLQEEVIKAMPSHFMGIYFKSNLSFEDKVDVCSFGVNINKALRMIRDNGGDQYGFTQNDIIMYACDDTYYYPGKIRAVVEHFRNHPESNVVYNGFDVKTVEANSDGEIVPCTRNPMMGMLVPDCIMNFPFNRDKLLEQNYIDHNDVSHRAHLLNNMSDPYWIEDARGWEKGDWFFWCRLLEQVDKFDQINQVLDTKYIHNGNFQSMYLNKMIQYIEPNQIME